VPESVVAFVLEAVPVPEIVPVQTTPPQLTDPFPLTEPADDPVAPAEPEIVPPHEDPEAPGNGAIAGNVDGAGAAAGAWLTCIVGATPFCPPPQPTAKKAKTPTVKKRTARFLITRSSRTRITYSPAPAFSAKISIFNVKMRNNFPCLCRNKKPPCRISGGMGAFC
jgi:hypothetical protein